MSRRFAALLLSSLRRRTWGWLASVFACLAAAATPAAAITIQFNYDYAAAGFFGTAAAPTPAREALDFAARAFTAFTDTLHPIVPGGVDSWTARFANPSSGAQESIANFVVPTNQVIVFAGAHNLSGSRLAEASRGLYTLPNPETLSQGFIDAIVNRGQGSSTVDFAPWGGAIAFDTTESDGDPRPWHFDPHTLPEFPANDFLSVAVHELAHLFGFGVNASSSFQAHVQNGQFAGPAAMALYGGSILLQGDGNHWANSVLSPPFVVDPPRAALGPLLFPGERLTLTPLDYAALADVGWEVTPELLRLPGDVDGDHDVDGADFLTWQRGVGGFGGTPGDANGDLVVDDYDGWMIRRFYGAVGAPDAGSASSVTGVPEPSAAMIIAFAACSGPLLIRGGSRMELRSQTAP